MIAFMVPVLWRQEGDDDSSSNNVCRYHYFSFLFVSSGQ